MATAVAQSVSEIDAWKSRLTEIVRNESFIHGREIRLASGRTSNFYFNLKPTMLAPEGAKIITDLILNLLRGANIDYVGGLAVGAIPLIANVSLASADTGRPTPGFFVRKVKKIHGTKLGIEGLRDLTILAGKTAVILDDVTTTGGSALSAVEVVRAEGCAVHKVITVVDRMEGAAENLSKHHLTLVPLLTAEDFSV